MEGGREGWGWGWGPTLEKEESFQFQTSQGMSGMNGLSSHSCFRFLLFLPSYFLQCICISTVCSLPSGRSRFVDHTHLVF